MRTLPGLFRLLEEDWSRSGRSSEAATALRRWSAGHSVLAGFPNPVAVVDFCHSRDARASALVGAVLVEAGNDRWAVRTVLQAVLPGIAAVARRVSCYVGGQQPVWQTRDELDQEVVFIAFERIHALAGTALRYPCRSVVDGTWQRVRHQAASARHVHGTRADVRNAVDVVAVSERSGLEELASTVIEAATAGTLGVLDAGLVYSCHVAGYRVTELSSLTGQSARSLWRHRRRAEEVLVAMERVDG